MDLVNQLMQDRHNEIGAYLNLLDALEAQIQAGPPRIGSSGPTITPQQVKILYSGVYLQLYNLVEAILTRCIDAISAAAAEEGRWKPDDLSNDLRREWVRYIAATHREQNYDSRLEKALLMCDHLVQRLPVSKLWIQKSNSGNWDRPAVTEIAKRLGLRLLISAQVDTAVKRHFRNEKGPLEFVKTLRNDLAHGRLSFVECGEGVTARELRNLTESTSSYLKEVVASFKSFIRGYEFLRPESRPAGAQA